MGLFGKKNLKTKDLTYKDLIGKNLTGVDFTGADLNEADLSYTNLTNANLTRANLTNATLNCTNLTNANLTGAKLTGAKLTDVKFTGTNLTNANLTGVNLSGTNLTDSIINCTNLTRTNLTNANLTGVNLTNANLTDANLTNTQFTGAKLSKQTNDKFIVSQLDFNDGLESVLGIRYGVSRESKVKLFFSTNDVTTFTKDYTEKISDNFVRLIIAVATRVNASFITGGNYDINTSDSKGYSLFVSLRHEDSKLLAVISNVLRSENFGCLPARFTISAHRNDDFPTNSMAMEILSKLNYKLSTAIQEMK